MHSTRKIQSLVPPGRMLLAALFGWMIVPVLPGCAMFETSAPLSAQSATPPTPASTPPAPLAWLTNWVSQPIEMAPGFDIESIKPARSPAIARQDDLIEVTVWDIYEPGKPYSFPVRVSARHSIEVPMLGEVPVEGHTLSQIESSLVDAYRTGEYLLNPRVLVRSLDAPIIKVQVAGAVNRAGFVELTHNDRSVYAAILSAGNLKKSSGTQVAVTRRAEAQGPAETAAVPAVTERLIEPAQHDGKPSIAPRRPHAPEQHANSVEDLTVPAAAPAVRPSGANQPLMSVGDIATGQSATGQSATGPNPNTPSAVVTATAKYAAPATTDRQWPANDTRRPDLRPGSNATAAIASGATGTAMIRDQATVWYDLALAHDREQLKSVVLSEGDIVTVKEAAPPLRIGGFVNRPGSFPLPPGRTLNAWQAIELAGGVRDETIPLNITLLRPAGDKHGARRWNLNVVDIQHHPAASPFVEAGDVLQVEPTTGSKIKRAVGDLWSKP